MSWLLLALITPFLWAVVATIDAYFVHGIYRDEYDGAIISGLFQVTPWFFVFAGIIPFTPLENKLSIIALLAGALFLLSSFTYFRALFVSNDAALMQILWNLSVLCVPFMAWIILGERLELMHYFGIGLAFCGISAFLIDDRMRKQGFPKILWLMLISVLLLSLSMILSRYIYENTADFVSVFLMFSLGASLTAIPLLLLKRRTFMIRIKGLLHLGRTYFFIFLLAEGLAVVGSITSQKAIELSPSVSFIAAIESLSPVFVLIISFILVSILKFSNSKDLRKVFQEQYNNLGSKLTAVGVIAIGIYLIS